MDKPSNPFNELYVSETVGARAFVEVFSSRLLHNASALYMPGNVVLKGMQGSGKSMLLTLLKPEVRAAYAELRKKFPLSGPHAKFISAGINLTSDGAISFGHRTIESANTDGDVLPIYFGDFLNYWVVYDLLSSIELFIGRAGGVIAEELGIDGRKSRLDEFARSVSRLRCWFGFLSAVGDYSALKLAIEDRISSILSFLNFNSDVLPAEIIRTKTTVGEPIAQVAQALHTAGIVPADVHLLVRIDQYEELMRLEGRQRQLGSRYREIVNKALSLRDPYVSYRIGTRGYAWDEHPRVYGTSGNLERDRNFKLVDLDEMLRRKENRKTWIFPEFAGDVFRRRLLFAGYQLASVDTVLRSVFGDGGTPWDRAQQYCRNSPERVLRLNSSWPELWNEYLRNLSKSDPLSARFGEAWSRQRGKSSVMNSVPQDTPVWNSAQHKYWRKERTQAALMQIAGRCGQRMLWYGIDDILELSGGNVLVFVSLCQYIWGAWLRTLRGRVQPSDNQLPGFDPLVQTVGIYEASSHWFNKLAEESGGTTRQRFVTNAATFLERNLYNDDALSYPGANGFSLELHALSQFPRLGSFLKECVDYGALVDAPHTTKESSRRPRQKWYLSAVLSPHFRLPHVHTKEPAYLHPRDVERWLDGVQFEVDKPVKEDPLLDAQGTLFGDGEP